MRINGTVNDPEAGFPWQDNYVITEDHYIDYFSGRAPEEVVPGQVLAKLKRANYLFLGYTIADWRLRVFLQRVWKGSRLGRAKYWAVEYDPDVLERDSVAASRRKPLSDPADRLPEWPLRLSW